MTEIPRIALFADTFNEINGAANVIRRLTDFAQSNDFPFLCIRGGKETRFIQEGELRILELKRHRMSIPVEGELKYDPFFWRYKKLIKEKLDEFKPDVLHVTGLNDVSQIGFFYAHYDSLPAVASWHTNTHEYAARRLQCVLRWLPSNINQRICCVVENTVMCGLMKLYELAQLQLAPNQELVEQIRKMTRRPSFLMSRGVDTNFLHPKKRCRTDSTLVLGYVGRLRPEKNVRFLAEVEKALRIAGITDYKFLIVGEGSEESWLKKNLSKAELTGTLQGEDLAAAFAGMDLFVFPSHTDAFGNVVLEAMAAGVPAIVMPNGGPKFLINHRVNGFIASNESDFLKAIVGFANQNEDISLLKAAARQRACEHSWERVFGNVYDKYKLSIKFGKDVRA